MGCSCCRYLGDGEAVRLCMTCSLPGSGLCASGVPLPNVLRLSLTPVPGHCKEAGTVSLEALAQGRHHVVEAISGEERLGWLRSAVHPAGEH